MKLLYMCVESALDLWPLGHCELGFFASRIGRSEMECAALGFLMYAVNLEMNNPPKWVLFNIVSGQITSSALWK